MGHVYWNIVPPPMSWGPMSLHLLLSASVTCIQYCRHSICDVAVGTGKRVQMYFGPCRGWVPPIKLNLFLDPLQALAGSRRRLFFTLSQLAIWLSPSIHASACKDIISSALNKITKLPSIAVKNRICERV